MGNQAVMTCIASKIGRPRGSSLTQTDIQVLRQIAKQGFQTYSELRVTALSGKSRQHSWRLLKRLVALEHLNECRGDGGRISGWVLTLKARKDLSHLFEKGWAVDRRPPSYRTSHDHDVVLREIRGLLEQSPIVSDWVPEHVIKADAMSRIKYLGARDRSAKLLAIPDALFQLKSGAQNTRGALELELTRKSKKRIFQKLEAHILSSEFDFVFTVLDGDSLLKLHWEIYQEVIASSVRLKIKDQQNGIYFSTLQNLREHRLHAIFNGLSGTFSLKSNSCENPSISSDSVA